MTDFMARVRDELVLAGERRASAASRTPARPRLRGRKFLIAAGLAVVLATPAAAAVGVWNPFDDTVRETPAPATSVAPPPSELTDLLGVLRRKQNDADQGPATEAALRRFDRGVSGVNLQYVRLLDFERGIVAVPVEKYGIPSQEQDAQSAGAVGTAALCLYVPSSDSRTAGGSCYDADSIRDGFSIGSSGSRVYGLVPDDVAAVRLSRGTHMARVPVANNLFFSEGDAPVDPTRIAWLAADGAVRKDIDLSAPGPQRPPVDASGARCAGGDPHCVAITPDGDVVMGPEATQEDIDRAIREAERQGRPTP